MKGFAIITGADGGMGQVITKKLVQAGFPIVMGCKEPEKAYPLRYKIEKQFSHATIRIEKLDLASLDSVAAFAKKINANQTSVRLLINNAGVLNTGYHQTEDGLENTVSVNYVGPYLLCRLLLARMSQGSRIINTVSCTYAIGTLNHVSTPASDFFTHGKKGTFLRIPVYANTKLALLLFTQELAQRLSTKAVTVNAADPGIVNTPMITMHKWFDPLTDIFFRPFIKTPEKGASTAIYLALSKEIEGISGCCFANCRLQKLPKRISQHPQQKILWETTEKIVKKYLSTQP